MCKPDWFGMGSAPVRSAAKTCGGYTSAATVPLKRRGSSPTLPGKCRRWREPAGVHQQRAERGTGKEECAAETKARGLNPEDTSHLIAAFQRGLAEKGALIPCLDDGRDALWRYSSSNQEE
jgi:hypothetical protein